MARLNWGKRFNGCDTQRAPDFDLYLEPYARPFNASWGKALERPQQTANKDSLKSLVDLALLLNEPQPTACSQVQQSVRKVRIGMDVFSKLKGRR